MERKGWRKEIQRCLGCHQSKRQEVIDALIDGHVKGTAKYLGPKRKEDKALSNQTRDIHSSWAVAAWEEIRRRFMLTATGRERWSLDRRWPF